MSAKSKLTLLLELKNKLFNNKLSQTKQKFSRTTDDMGNKVNRLKGQHTAAFSAMQAESGLFSRAMELIGNPYVLIMAGLLALGTLMGKGFVEAKKFNHEFLQIQQLNLDKPKAELATYKELIRDSAFESGKSAVDTAKAYYDLQSALGVYGKEAKSIFTEVANYSTATGAELGDSINSTSKAMKAFNLGAKDTKMLLESNAKTVQVGITTYKELAQVQTEYAGAASGAGQSVDTANKIFAAFTSIAKDSNTAATMAKTAFQGLTQASTVKGLKSIGISLYDAEGNMRNLDKVLIDVNDKFKSMSPKEIDELINKIGGPEGLRALFTKLKTGSDDFFKTLSAYDSSQFNLGDALKNAQGDVTVLSQIVGNQLNTILTKLGDVILPFVAKGLQFFSKFLGWLYPKLGILKSMILGIGIAFAIVKVPYIIFAGIVMAKNFLMGLSFQALGTAIKNVPIIGWIAAAIALFITLYQECDKFRAMIDGVVEVFKSLVPLIAAIAAAMANPLDPSGWMNVKKAWNDLDFGAAFDKGYENSLNKSKKAREEKEAAENGTLFDDGTGGNTSMPEDGGGAAPTTGAAVSNVTGAASAPRSITVNIDAFNKGGINTQNTTLAKMDKSELEAWFNEAMMRVIRNVEMS